MSASFDGLAGSWPHLAFTLLSIFFRSVAVNLLIPKINHEIVWTMCAIRIAEPTMPVQVSEYRILRVTVADKWTPRRGIDKRTQFGKLASAINFHEFYWISKCMADEQFFHHCCLVEAASEIVLTLCIIIWCESDKRRFVILFRSSPVRAHSVTAAAVVKS